MSPKRPAVPITIDGTTYDVSAWINHHPGGAAIIENYRNRDATDAFMVMHSQEALNKLKRMPVMEPNSPRTPVPPKPNRDEPQEDFRKLREELIAEGMFKASPMWYTYKTATTLGLGLVAVLLISQWHWYLLGAIFLGMHFQQMGWLSHDICHHQVFADRNLNNTVGLLFGNVMQGFSVTWWKDRHNTHHSATNVQGHDPDIDNLPLLAWSKEDVNRASPGTRKLIQYQQYYFLGVCTLLRFIWCIQSFRLVMSLKECKTNHYYRSQYTREAVTLSLHWILKAVFYYLYMPNFLTGLMVFLISELLGGFGIAIVVFMNHYPLDKIQDSAWDGHGFAAGQIHETMNVKRGLLTDWFFGGLNYQIEHHLWPTLPRHNLTAVSRKVEVLCKKHNLPYRAPGVSEGVGILLSYLGKFAKLAKASHSA